MIAELGLFSVVIAFIFSVLLATIPLTGVRYGAISLISLASPLAKGVLFFTLIAYLVLTMAFVSNDFSVTYVAMHSNSTLPLFYKITAVWGGHEGSFLLWTLIFTLWMSAVATFKTGIPPETTAKVLSVMGLIGAFFFVYIILASNPFELTLPFYPVDGRDLNPLLQDPGMIVHPPLLYMGYVGFSVVFAFAIVALLEGKIDNNWAKWVRKWTLAAWMFLTLGITIGSWWAYNELGWGGWWFWDPVENASFMPWLIGTALIHSLAVTEQRNTFKVLTLILAISAFSLSLLGTFLVRSGVLISVHAFASDPTRGLFILVMLLFVIGGSLLLFGLKAKHFKDKSSIDILSRESALMMNNLFLTTATVVVLVGTMLPMFYSTSGLGSISIGAPFFNQIFSYLFIPFGLLMAIYM